MAKEKIIDPLLEEAELDTAEPRMYELGFHIDGELGETEAKKVYQDIRTAISAVGEVISEGEPTKIPLAYTISISNTQGRRDFNSAFFSWIAYNADTKGHEGITARVTEETKIIRFIDLRTTKDEALHSAQMHEIFAQEALLRNSQVEEEEEIAEVVEAEATAPETVV